MATGTTLTILTRGDKDYKGAVSSADAGTPTAGEPQFIYDDGETQEDLLRALEQAKMWVTENVLARK